MHWVIYLSRLPILFCRRCHVGSSLRVRANKYGTGLLRSVPRQREPRLDPQLTTAWTHLSSQYHLIRSDVQVLSSWHGSGEGWKRAPRGGCLHRLAGPSVLIGSRRSERVDESPDHVVSFASQSSPSHSLPSIPVLQETLSLWCSPVYRSTSQTSTLFYDDQIRRRVLERK
jgi:hypothetical protein